MTPDQRIERQKRISNIEGGRVVTPVRLKLEVSVVVSRLAKERKVSVSKLIAEWTEAHVKAAVMSDNEFDRAMELGKAGEHLVAADLILKGYRCFLSYQVLPYALVVEAPEGLKRVQVRSSLQPRNVNSTGRNARIAYSWNVRRRGRDGKGSRLSNSHCDLVALVALDIKAIAYLPVNFAGATVQLIPPGEGHKTKARHGWGWSRNISEFPFEDALKGDPSIYQPRQVTHCPKGHEYTEQNTMVKRGRRHCRRCSYDDSIARAKRRRLKNAK